LLFGHRCAFGHEPRYRIGADAFTQNGEGTIASLLVNVHFGRSYRLEASVDETEDTHSLGVSVRSILCGDTWT